MQRTEIHQTTAGQSIEEQKAYSSPRLRCLSPEAARELLMQHCDTNDPGIKHLLDCVEQLKSKRAAHDP